MRQSLCEAAVVCQEQQTFRFCVQPSNVEQLREFWWQQIKNSIVRPRISPGRNESCRLVQHDGEWRRNMDKFAIHFDVVASVGFCAEVGASLTVDSDSPRRDQFIALPARSETRSGEEAIKAHECE
jgi:hypothetical protein